jgi:bifunctional non-homologous end joining protein LigD
VERSAQLEDDGAIVFEHACLLGAEGIVSKPRGSRYQSGRNPAPAQGEEPGLAGVKRESEEDWSRG